MNDKRVFSDGVARYSSRPQLEEADMIMQPPGDQEQQRQNAASLLDALVNAAPNAPSFTNASKMGVDEILKNIGGKENCESSKSIVDNKADPLQKDGSIITDVRDAARRDHHERSHENTSKHKDTDTAAALKMVDEGTKEKIWPGMPTNTELRAIAESMSEQEKSSHREILLGLFLQCSTSELESLAGKTNLRFPTRRDLKRARLDQEGQQASAQRHRDSKKQKSAVNLTIGSVRSLLGPPQMISILPLVLSSLVEKLYGDNARSTAPIDEQDEGISLKRENYESLTMRELKRKVLSKFEATPTGQLAISTENALYTKFLSSTETVPAAAIAMVQQARRKFTPMALQYNECSMSALASWAFSDGPVTHHLGGLQTEIPASSVLFHLCQVCDKWGHYEVECEFIAADDRKSDVAREVHSLKKLRGLEKNPLSETPPNAVLVRTCDICKYAFGQALSPFQTCKECGSMCHCICLDPSWECSPQQDWICKLCTEKNHREEGRRSSVDVEGCDGYVIEQRKTPAARPANEYANFVSTSMGVNFGDASWSTAVCIADEKNLASFVSVQSKEDPSFSHPNILRATEKGRDFALGELCWARRSHSDPGNYARDEWWPAQVINQITDARSFQQFGTDMTPYLVKFFAIPRASRVRASHILPFFDNFRAVGYSRISGAKAPLSDSDIRFRKGVEEVIGMMGYKSLKQLLVHSDEMATTAIAQTETRKTEGKKSDAFTTWFKQDRFVIRAKESDGKADPNSATKPSERVQGLSCQEPVKTYRRTKIVGCVVAWMSMEQSESVMSVGTVLAANIKSKVALVSPIPDWERTLQAPSARNKVVVRHHRAAPAEWMPMNKLHMIANGPEEGFKKEITNHVISDLLVEARTKLATSASDPGSDVRDKLIASLQECPAPRREIEGILKERNTYAGREYLVKWIGLPSSYSTWKPESAIENKKFVLLFNVNRLINALSLSAPMKEVGSTTLRVVAALQAGRQELEAVPNFPCAAAPDAPCRICPFCDDVLEGSKFPDHIKIHDQAKNYAMIREAARLAQMRWYEK